MIADVTHVAVFGRRIKGIYYVVASHEQPQSIVDWTDTTNILAPAVFLSASLLAWIAIFFFLRKQSDATRDEAHEGAAFFFAVSSVPAFWIVPSVTCDVYDLELNVPWVVSMLFANVVFFSDPLFKGLRKEYFA